MSDRTKIEWTEATWNPVRGCSRVSEGCRHCFAERIAARFSGPGRPYEGLARMTPSGPRWTGEIRLLPELLEQPLRWRKPRRIFVNSMSDLFHEKVSDETLARIWLVMAWTSQEARFNGRRPVHTYQILTKRPERMREWLAKWSDRDSRQALVDRIGDHEDREFARLWPDALPNVWLGASVEDQRAADQRIPCLVQTPAAVRFLSCEPLLGPVNLTLIEDPGDEYGDGAVYHDTLTGERWMRDGFEKELTPTDGIDWVIVGGESGPGARPMHPEWARSLRDQCQAAGVPFFFKQWGEWAASDEATGEYALARPSGHIVMKRRGERYRPNREPGDIRLSRVGKRRAGRLLDGRTWDEMPA